MMLEALKTKYYLAHISTHSIAIIQDFDKSLKLIKVKTHS